MPGRHVLPLVSALGFGLVACGGTDRGRPSSSNGDAGAVESAPCRAADGYALQNLVDFEGEPASVSDQPEPVTTARCDPAISCLSNPFYFNFDLAQSNEDLSDPGTCPGEPMLPGVPTKEQGCDCIVPVNPGVLPVTDPKVGSTLHGKEVVGGRCDVPSYALHFTATNMATCYGPNGRQGWGGGLDVQFNASNPVDPATGAGGAGGADGAGGESGEPAPRPGANGFDASSFDGISFWVRKGGAGKTSFIMTVSDPGTTTPICSEVETDPDAKKCDAFGIAITLTDEWTFVPARFSAMRQKGFGKPSPLGRLDSSNVKKIQFLMGPGDWDFWLDDLAFFKEPQ